MKKEIPYSNEGMQNAESKEKYPGIKFLHSPNFDSEPEYEVNDWHKISGIEDIREDGGKIIWAWPVKVDDVVDFLDDNAYGDNGPAQWEEIDPAGKFVYAVPYDAFRNWLKDEEEVEGKKKVELPFLEHFDPKRHAMDKKNKLVGTRGIGFFDTGYFDEDGNRIDDEVEVADFSTDFAVIISPIQMTKRWNKVWEGDNLEEQEAAEEEFEKEERKKNEQREREINPRKFKN